MGLGMEGFVGKEEDFEVDALRYREPMEFLENWGDVVAGVGEQASIRVLYELEFEEFG